MDLDCLICDEPAYEPQVGDRVQQTVVPGGYKPNMGAYLVIGFTGDKRQAILQSEQDSTVNFEFMDGDAFQRQPWAGGYVQI
jgi:hypothetical protein